MSCRWRCLSSGPRGHMWFCHLSALVSGLAENDWCSGILHGITDWLCWLGSLGLPGLAGSSENEEGSVGYKIHNWRLSEGDLPAWKGIVLSVNFWFCVSNSSCLCRLVDIIITSLSVSSSQRCFLICYGWPPGESFVILVSLLSALTEAPPNLGYAPFMQTNFLIFPSLNTTHICYLPYSSVSSCSPVKRCMLALYPSLEHKFLDSQGQRIEAVRRLTFPLLYYLRIFTLCMCNLLK